MRQICYVEVMTSWKTLGPYTQGGDIWLEGLITQTYLLFWP